MSFTMKRAYEPPTPRDGIRVLVERLWPRGLTKKKARIDEWLREMAPSTALRQWFHKDPTRWPEFRRRYRAELRDHRDALKHLRTLGRTRRVTLIYSAHDREHNAARVVLDRLKGR